MDIRGTAKRKKEVISMLNIKQIIDKKRVGKPNTAQEIDFFVEGIVTGAVTDAQIAAYCMAVCIHGLAEEETIQLTLSMAKFGDTYNLSAVKGVTVDKHSTGGVGDTTTLVIAPVVAANGLVCAKMSGRGLGFTGGTIDKLSAIPGMRTDLTMEQFLAQLQTIGIALCAQTGEIAPADGRIYAVRDETATVESLSLIASSIMSKKLAVNSDAIVLDVKFGNGALLKTQEEAHALAQLMVRIGGGAGKRMCALITDMSAPLGRAIGNAAEVAEAVEILTGMHKDTELYRVCRALAAEMLYIGGAAESVADGETLFEQTVASGAAYNRFVQWIEAQGGDATCLPTVWQRGNKAVVTAQTEGYVTAIDAMRIGNASLLIGCGRMRKQDAIDVHAGILLKAQVGDFVHRGALLAEIYAKQPEVIAQEILQAFTIGAQPVGARTILCGRVTNA